MTEKFTVKKITSSLLIQSIFFSSLQEGLSSLKRIVQIRIRPWKKSNLFYLQEIKELDAEEVPGFVLVNGRSLTDILREYVG